MATVPKEKRIAVAKKASAIAAARLSQYSDPYKVKYGRTVVRRISAKLVNAKGRCTNPKNTGYANYGGRGICFSFPTIRAATEWVLDNIGAPSTDLHSLDRIDNNRGYEPGNLRWATPEEQNRNKRTYKRTVVGERIRTLLQHRPDLTYETLRIWIRNGATDNEIVNRRKYASARV